MVARREVVGEMDFDRDAARTAVGLRIDDRRILHEVAVEERMETVCAADFERDVVRRVRLEGEGEFAGRWTAKAGGGCDQGGVSGEYAKRKDEEWTGVDASSLLRQKCV